MWVRVCPDTETPRPGVELSPTELVITEGDRDTYSVRLTEDPDPAHDGLSVTIALNSTNSDVTAFPQNVTLDATNWRDGETITVSAEHDPDAENDAASITHNMTYHDGTMETGDSLSVTVEDDDTVEPPVEPVEEPGVRLSVSSLTVEEGGSRTYTVVLESEPDGPVTVTATSANPAVVSVSPRSRHFDSSNWREAQDFTVTAVSDTNTIGESVMITHSVAGYGDVEEGRAVTVTVDDISPPEPPPVEEAERAALTETLATVTATTVSNVTSNIGARFSAARTGTSLSLAGQSATQAAALEATEWNSLWDGETHSRALSSDDLLRSTDFQIVLGASDSAYEQTATQWTFWGRGDLQYFSSEPDQGSTYSGDLGAGYLGLDTQVDDQWLAGVALSRTKAEVDYSLGTGGPDTDGSLDVTLNSLVPYVRFSPSSESELWAILGAGQGDIENSRPGADSDRERSDVAMWMASAGGRQALAIADPLDWAVLADVGFGQVFTEAGVEAIAGLTVDTWQARLGVEGSYTVEMESGDTVTAFMEVAGRFDGGDENETGLELSPGMFIFKPDSGLGLEVRGRALVFHSAENYEEFGLSATASVTPRSDGQGLSLSLSPRWGVATGGAVTLWREDAFGRLDNRSHDRDALSLAARVGYGIKMMNGLVLPFTEFNLRDENSQQTRIGTEFSTGLSNLNSLSLELSGERLERHGANAEHRVSVISRLRF